LAEIFQVEQKDNQRMARGNSQKAAAPQNGSGAVTSPKHDAPEPGKSLESWIWDAACSIRGAKDAGKYKEFILPLIFTKRLCDVFDDELNRIGKEVGSRQSIQAGEARQETCALLPPASAEKPG
jgi:type I restriction-modification system DNA methylase subunit